jgi:hypothetical protein
MGLCGSSGQSHCKQMYTNPNDCMDRDIFNVFNCTTLYV